MIKMEKHSVEYGSKLIEFTLVRKNVKNINISISPSLEVKVSASEQVPIDFIKKIVLKNGKKILKDIKTFMKTKSEVKHPKKYISGESFKYLGKQYRLKVRKHNENQVKYIRGFIYLFVTDTEDFSLKERLINEWYLERLNIISEILLSKLSRKVNKHGIKMSKLNFRKMSSRWGSCHYDSNKITLNLDLIESPKFCIEYVILHELIHFKHNSHNKSFYDMLFSLMPDWEFRKNILDYEIVKDL